MVKLYKLTWLCPYKLIKIHVFIKFNHVQRQENYCSFLVRYNVRLRAGVYTK